MRLTEKRCAHCKFCEPAVDDAGSTASGWCHRAPPRPMDTGSPTQFRATHAIVNLARGWCGEYRRAWWRWLKA
jgi:hypothetical protein